MALKTYDNSRGPIRLKMGVYFATKTDSNPLSSTQNQLANESFDQFHQNPQANPRKPTNLQQQSTAHPHKRAAHYRATKAPIDPSAKIHAAIKRNAMDLGLACYPNGGTINGVEGDHVLLAPPYLINAQQIDEIVSKLGDAVDRSLKNHSLECR